MPENIIPAIIDIKQVDLDDKRFKVSLSASDINTLATSIKTAGLIHPVLVRPARQNSFTIISGFSRIQALIQNNISKIPASILPENTTDLDCYKKAAAALAFKRPLTHAELIICVKHLKSCCDIQKINQMAPAIFNLTLNCKFIQDLLQIAKLPDPCLDLIQSEHLTIKSARRLADFDAQTTAAFLDLFSKIKASSSKQLEIIIFINEICARDGIRVDNLYHQSRLQEILLNPDQPLGVKTHEIRQFLYQKRFPTIFDTRQKVQNFINALKLGNHLKLMPPENFEARDYSFVFTAKNIQQFNAHLEKLNQLSKDNALEPIFKS